MLDDRHQPPASIFLDPVSLSSSTRSFRAKLSDGRIVFLKRSRSHAGAAREAKLLRRARGPFAPRLLRLARDGASRWLAMEWIDGEAWPGASGADRSAVAGLLRALVHLHRSGVVHGDLKPANVLARRDGSICIVDFEFASLVDETPDDSALGATEGYLAPERRAHWPADPRSDLYSVGVMIERHTDDETLLEIARQLTARRPTQRPAGAEAVLATVVAGDVVGAIPSPQLDSIGWRRGRPSTARLSQGIGVWLGVDELLAERLARVLLFDSGGIRDVATVTWKRWLSSVTNDPWQPVELDADDSVSTLRAMLRAELQRWFDRLPLEEKVAARKAWHAWRTFSREDVARFNDAVTAPRSLSPDELERLTANGLLKEESGRYRFAVETLWRLATPDGDVEPELHASLARSIEQTTTESTTMETLDRLSWHWQIAGHPAESADYAFRAADAAIIEGRHADAVELYDRAIETEERAGLQSPPSAKRFDRLRRRATTLADLGHTDRARESVEQMTRDATPELGPFALAAQSDVLYRLGDHAASLAAADRALVSPDLDGALRARLHLTQATAYYARQELDHAEASASESIDCQVEPTELTASATQLIGLSRWLQGDLPRGVEHLTDAVRLAETGRHSRHLLKARQNRAGIMAATERWTEARRDLKEAEQLASLLDLPSEHADIQTSAGWLELLTENFDDAAQKLAVASGLARQIGDAVRLTNAAVPRVTALARLGRVPEASRLLSSSIRVATVNDAPALPDLLNRHLMVRCWYEERAAESPIVDEVTRRLDALGDHQTRFDAVTHLALHDAVEGRIDEARERLDGIEPIDAGWLSLTRARVERIAGDSDGARRHAVDAYRHFRDRTHQLYGRASALLLFFGTTDSPSHPEERTLDDLIELSMQLRAKRIEALARILRSKSRGGSRGRNAGERT